MELVSKLYFSIFVFSLIVFLDLLIKFKRPIIIKVLLALITLCSGILSLLQSLSIDITWFFFAGSILKGTISLSIIYLFTILYLPEFKRWANLSLIIYLVYEFVLFNFLYNSPNSLAQNKIEPFLLVIITKFELPLYLNLFRIAVTIIILGNVLYLCYTILVNQTYQNIYFDKIKRWTKTLVFYWIFITIAFLFLHFFELPAFLFYMLSFSSFIVLQMFVFYRPTFLNRSSLKISLGKSFNKDENYAISQLEFINEFYTKLYFVQQDASLENLAAILKISSNDLYKFIYYKYSMTFNDLVNKNRVDYFIDIIHDAKYINYTIDALAKEAGFSSRQHLYKPFKKFHGGNPSDIMDAING
jgi:AraC-like DNA-binding protein